MFARSILLRGTVLCVLLVAALGVFAGSKAKEPAPRFNAKTIDGEKFTNDYVKGKVVLLEFWTTWCVYCFEEAGLVDQTNREFRDKGLIVLAVDVAESKKTVKRYLDQHPRTSSKPSAGSKSTGSPPSQMATPCEKDFRAPRMNISLATDTSSILSQATFTTSSGPSRQRSPDSTR